MITCYHDSMMSYFFSWKLHILKTKMKPTRGTFHRHRHKFKTRSICIETNFELSEEDCKMITLFCHNQTDWLWQTCYEFTLKLTGKSCLLSRLNIRTGKMNKIFVTEIFLSWPLPDNSDSLLCYVALSQDFIQCKTPELFYAKLSRWLHGMRHIAEQKPFAYTVHTLQYFHESKSI
jgi:hypothetical protein